MRLGLGACTAMLVGEEGRNSAGDVGWTPCPSEGGGAHRYDAAGPRGRAGFHAERVSTGEQEMLDARTRR